MTPEQATFLLNEIYLPQIRNEHKTTRRVIDAIPADNSDWKPDPTSKSALELAWHIASSECFFLNGIAAGKYEKTGDASSPTSKGGGRENTKKPAAAPCQPPLKLPPTYSSGMTTIMPRPLRSLRSSRAT